ncbi:xylulokinase [Kineococcus gynurae]|uniref:Xylulose kinase n=2 Tax=Kineococcus gynurae TaxID=452979 RepID=A0ABV5LVE9_9ACTN
MRGAGRAPDGVVAGIDSSTQSCKVELRDLADARLLAVGRAPHPPAPGGVSEQDPQAWWEALGRAMRAALDAAPPGTAQRVVALSVAAQCHGLVPLDARGAVLRPAKLWNDTTCAPELARLRQRVDDATWARRVGTVPTPAFTIGKLAWLAAHEPANLRALATVLLPHDYLTFRLTGERVTDRSEASGTGYFDATADDGRGRWLPDLLALVDPDGADPDKDWAATLPRVARPDEVVGRLTPVAAEHLGLPGGVLVGPGGGDQHAAALGLGAGPGDVTFSLGTSGVVFTPSAHPVHDPSGTIDGVADLTGGWLPLVSTLNAARVTDQVAGWLGVDAAGLSALALAAGPGEGPAFVPFLEGERTPDLPRARGVIAGLDSRTTREDLARAAVEGVLLGLVNGLDRMREFGVDVSGRVLVVGGAARSPAYRQLLADLLGTPTLVPDADEASARGACVQAAAVALGVTVPEQRDRWRPAILEQTVPRPSRRDPGALYRRTVADAAVLAPT